MKKLNIKRFAKFGASSVISTAVDAGLFWLVMRLFAEALGGWTELVATVIARIISSVVNFSLNKLFVFKGKHSLGPAMVRYITLAAVQMLCSAGLVTLINNAFGNEKALIATIIKLGVDSVLFFASYNIQRIWVFPAKKAEKTGDAEHTPD